MCRVIKAIVFAGALMMINVGIAFGAHWEAFEDCNADLCFKETEKVANGADPETLSTIHCTRALRVKPLTREDRSAILYNRGIIQKAQGYLVAARASFERAVHLSRTVDQRNLALAEAARELGDYRVALEQYDLLTRSAFAADSEDLRVAVVARREEIDGVSDYFAGFKKAQACTACHGLNGISVNPERPTLAGRREDHLEQALRQHKNGQRQNAVMTSQATLIADEDIPLLAHYFASLDGLETTRVD